MSQTMREALSDARSVICSINASAGHRVKVGDEWCYWQREEWVRWALDEVLPKVEAALFGPSSEQAQQGAEHRLSEAEIEDCIDRANRKFNGRRQGPSGQQATTYDDWKHWLAREIESALASRPAAAAPQGMTIAGDGAAMLGKLMREQRASRLGVYPDGNPNASATEATAPAVGVTDPHGHRAFSLYLEDCDKHAIEPDAAGAFHWLWTHRAALAGAAQGAEPEDTHMLNWLREESCDLRCIDIPTGQGDGDVDWIVVGHYQAKPHEREVGRAYSDEPREAIRAAMLAASPQPPTGTSQENQHG